MLKNARAIITERDVAVEMLAREFEPGYGLCIAREKVQGWIAERLQEAATRPARRARGSEVEI
jgi:hypothetical protein